MSSRRKEKQKRKEERRLAPPKRPRSPPIPAEYTLVPDVDRTPEEFAALLEEPGAVELTTCARCATWFDLSQGEGVEYGDGDKSGIYFCSACFIEISP